MDAAGMLNAAMTNKDVAGGMFSKFMNFGFNANN